MPGEVPAGKTLLPLGSTDVRRPGRDGTVIATARLVGRAPRAAAVLAAEGIPLEVYFEADLRPLLGGDLLRVRGEVAGRPGATS